MSSKKVEEINILVVDDEDKICELIKIFLLKINLTKLEELRNLNLEL